MTVYNLIYSTSITKVFTADYKILYDEIISDRNHIIITDKNVAELYEFDPKTTIIIEPGESSKSISTVEKIYSKLSEMEVDRSYQIVGVGGGVVTDLTGFVASTYKRGLKFGFIPTSLIGMADAAIGGKNGINYQNTKNQIGVVNQPDFVGIDINFLKTLPKEEFTSGLSEVIKLGLISDVNLYNLIENKIDELLEIGSVMEEIIHRSILIKSAIVKIDEYDSGRRQILNFGHTIGHAIESITGISHGNAVAIGMLRAIKISEKLVGLDPSIRQRLTALFEKIEVPIQLKVDNEQIIEHIRQDKKRYDDQIRFILLNDFASPSIKELSLMDMENLL